MGGHERKIGRHESQCAHGAGAPSVKHAPGRPHGAAGRARALPHATQTGVWHSFFRATAGAEVCPSGRAGHAGSAGAPQAEHQPAAIKPTHQVLRKVAQSHESEAIRCRQEKAGGSGASGEDAEGAKDVVLGDNAHHLLLVVHHRKAVHLRGAAIAWEAVRQGGCLWLKSRQQSCTCSPSFAGPKSAGNCQASTSAGLVFNSSCVLQGASPPGPLHFTNRPAAGRALAPCP